MQALLSSAAPALRRASAPSKPPVSKTAKPARKKGVQSKPKARPRHDSSEEDSDGGSVGSLDDFIVDDSDTSDSKPASSKKAKPASRAPVDPSYVSLALPFPEVVFSVVSDVVDDGLPVLPPEYVIGDATKPSRFLQRVLPDGSPGSLDDTAIILHCVDASGKWGSGGLFSAFDAL